MAKEKTSLWIAKLSNAGKALMHDFLKYLNMKNEPKVNSDLKLLDADIEALGVIFSRLKLQKSVSEINDAIKVFNNLYGIKILLIND